MNEMIFIAVALALLCVQIDVLEVLTINKAHAAPMAEAANGHRASATRVEMDAHGKDAG